MNESLNYTAIKYFESWPASTNGPQTNAKDPLVSEGALTVVETALNEWLSLVVCLAGIVANIIEICVFTKQGFKDTVNISMTFIAFWDLVRVISGTGHRLYGPISLFSPSFAVTWQNVTSLNLTYLHNLSSNVSYVLGAYVAVERCMCVSVPFKVKTILTPKLTTAFCAFVSVFVFVSLFPMFLVFEPKWVYSDLYKSYIMIYKYTEFFKLLGTKYLEANQTFNIVYPIISLTVMVVCTIVISYHLRKSLKYRQGLTRDDTHKTHQKQIIGNQKYIIGNDTWNKGHQKYRKGQTMSTKEKQVVKMLLLIINIYIINLIPRVLCYLAMLCVPEFYPLKSYNNIYWVIVYFVFFLDFLHSSVHLFIFYVMSSNFRKTFDLLFGIQTKNKPV